MNARVLVLGGTAEGRELAQRLDAAGVDVLTSLAGATRAPAAVAGQVRTGGYGGAAGLEDFLRTQAIAGRGFAGVVDATHPFATAMTANAAVAAPRAGVPVLRLARPGWSGHPDAARWTWVADHAAAAAVASELAGGRRVFLAVGRQASAAYAGALAGVPVLLRVADRGEATYPPGWMVVAARGPFGVADERELLRAHDVGVLVTKDSGGAPAAKLDAAREAEVPVVVVARPAVPEGMPQVTTVEAAFAWCRGLAGRTSG